MREDFEVGCTMSQVIETLKIISNSCVADGSGGVCLPLLVGEDSYCTYKLVAEKKDVENLDEEFKGQVSVL